ncbi:MAG: GDP-mannose 4,6-dehydratase [Candidatus ainarchaeum sp.]|nr:GDP-mannose 4,6-dehydratase [Candidatus ainarchaeum sp.]
MAWLSGKRAVITGAGGFLGSRLHSRLSGLGAEVLPIDRERDVRDKSILTPVFREGDVIFHLAGLANPQYCSQHPEEALSVNALGTLGVLEAALAKACSLVVLASTSHVYGVPQRMPVDELHPVAPSSPYGASKALAESFCSYYSRFRGLKTVTLRFFNIYGPGQRGDYLIPTITRQLGGDTIRIRDFAARRDYLYVDDAIEAFLLAASNEKAAGDVFNIGGGKLYSAKEVAETISSLSGKNLPVAESPSPDLAGGARELSADTSKAQKILGWKQAVPLEQGLRRVLGTIGN